MKKNISRNPLWPDWYNGKKIDCAFLEVATAKIDEVQFGRAFLEQWPLKCVNGTLYTLDGPVEDESEIKQRILENIEEYVTSGLSKGHQHSGDHQAAGLFRPVSHRTGLPPPERRVPSAGRHLSGGLFCQNHLPDGTFQESRLKPPAGEVRPKAPTAG